MTRSEPSISTTSRRILDEYLVVAAQGGDRQAFADLVRRWQRPLLAHAWRLLGDDEAARDAVQAAWLEIARGLGRLRDEKAFPAWAYRIVSRRCARMIAGARHRRALTKALSSAMQVEPVADTLQPEIEAGDQARRLRTAVASLPPAQRATVALFHFEGLSIAETSVALDVPAGTIKTRLMHARRALRVVLEGDDHG